MCLMMVPGKPGLVQPCGSSGDPFLCLRHQGNDLLGGAVQEHLFSFTTRWPQEFQGAANSQLCLQEMCDTRFVLLDNSYFGAP